MNCVSDLVILVNIQITKADCSIALFRDLDFNYIYLTLQKTLKLIL